MRELRPYEPINTPLRTAWKIAAFDAYIERRIYFTLRGVKIIALKEPWEC